MQKLPENPTPAQLKAIVQAIIRDAFGEEDAVVQGEVEAVDGGGWYARYTTAGQNFEVTYQDGEFVKGPVGATEEANPEFDEYVDLNLVFA